MQTPPNAFVKLQRESRIRQEHRLSFGAVVDIDSDAAVQYYDRLPGGDRVASPDSFLRTDFQIEDSLDFKSKVRPRFKNAEFSARVGEYRDAHEPHPGNIAS
jgi:hypothetical protein